MTYGERTLSSSEETAKLIMEMLPQLKTFYSQLNDMTSDWNVNGISKQIEGAVSSGISLGGYDPVMFIVMCEVFTALKRFMQTPVVIPDHVLNVLGVEAVTPEFAVRYKWLPVSAVIA